MLKNNRVSLLAAIALSAFVFGGPVAMAAGAKASPAKSAALKAQAAELEAPVSGAVTVSDYEFNTFVFPGTLKRVLFPSGSPVLGKPIYLADNTQVMLQFTKGVGSAPVQMVAELEGGAVVTLRVVPRAIPGVVHAVNGARVRSPSANRIAKAAPASGAAVAPNGGDVELLKYLMVQHEPPAGFEPVSLPAAVRFDKFSVVPLSSWADGGPKRIMVFSLVAVPGQTAVVAAPQFYRPGITAVLLDGDVVDAANSPQLFVVEELADE